MNATTPPDRPSRSPDPLPAKWTRAKIACNKCRKLKTRCFNNNDGTPCVWCRQRNIPCVYSDATPVNTDLSQSNSTSPASSGPSPTEIFAGGVYLRQSMVPQAVAPSRGQGFRSSNVSSMQDTQAEGSDTRHTAEITNAPANVVQDVDRPDVLPQIPIGGFSRVMDALNRENAEKYPGMRMDD